MIAPIRYGARHAVAPLVLVFAACGLVDPIDPAPRALLDSSGGMNFGGTQSTGASTPVADGGTTAGSSNRPSGGRPSETGGAQSGGAVPTQGGAQTGGQTSIASTGGSAGTQCTTHTDCGARQRCRPNHGCAALLTQSSIICSQLLGEEHAGDPRAIFLGAFAPLDQSNIEARTVRAIYELATNDFNGTTGGLRGEANAAPNPLVVILCNNDNADVPQALAHLVREVGVPGIIAAMDINQLRAAVETYSDTFFVSALGASQEFASVSEGRAWTMLGQPADYADIYAALMPYIEGYVRRSIDDPRPIRVAAVVEDNNAFEQDLSRAVVANLRFNGLTVLDNLGANPPSFASYTVTSNGSNVASVVSAIYAFQPDVVFSFASDTFTAKSGIMPTLDRSAWSNERPFYVLSPENQAADRDVHDELGRLATVDTKDHAGRVIGVGAALPEPENRWALQDFTVRLTAALPGARTDFGNYYDAFYFLTYALYASGPRAALLDGTVAVEHVAGGMRRLIHLSEPAVPINAITSVFNRLDVQGTPIQVYGTLGPPDFDANSGMRRESGSVYCFDPSKFLMQADVLRFDRETNLFRQSDPSPCLFNFLVAPP